ncbi:ABC transporter permease [Thiomicrospira microaerophila]|uniref:ABC transporter permease n=1 Tax=Thiomicrospira microaerophila TaxID=406020 RepID=UPI0005CAE388|nr:iron ABC transporter permease [Thiomicrospira microaerophila]
MNSKTIWQISLWALIILISLPLLRLLSAWFEPNTEIWQHLYDTLLWTLVGNTLWLLLGVAIGVTLLGVVMAWFVTMCEFPGRKWLEWMLFLPFAIPAYVLGFVYLGLFDFPGPVQSFLRDTFGWSGLDIRQGSLSIIIVMTLVLYPYVYMLARNAFYSQGNGLIESARLLGYNPYQVLWHVSIPLARPAIAAGVMLALMETLADFGTVSIFNYSTLTSGIFSVWEDFRSLQAAAQLSTALLGIAVLLILIERWSRGRARYDATKRMNSRPYKLKGAKAWLVTALVSSVVFLAFILPVSQLLIWASKTLVEEWDSRYLDWISNSFMLAFGAALLTVGLAVIVNSVRMQARLSWPLKVGIRFANLGYALPGSVLAVGIMLLIIDLGELVAPGAGIWLSSGVFALLLAYMVRFLAVAYGPVESSFDTITPSMTEAARSLGASTPRLVSDVYFPILKPGLVIAGFMVAVDVMKELPATYLLRPYGWDTLAIRIYELSSEGLYDRAAIPSLMLLLLGLASLYMVHLINKRYKIRAR